MAIIFSVTPETICRRVAKERREQCGYFILPISKPGERLRFLVSDVEAFLRSRSTASSPVNVVNTTAQHKEEKVVKQERESLLAAARATLERHRNKTGRKTN